MAEQSVCAVVVSYHPTAAMIGNVLNFLAQTQDLVVVDNGSGADALALLRAASNSYGFALIENAENLGIAEALNQGVLWAKGKGYAWVILFDQDSRITEDFVAALFSTWQLHPRRELLASINPRYVNLETGIEPGVFRAADGGPVFTLTSGSLMPMWIFERIGLFSSEYFIDQVDTEYCFRIRGAGYLIADSRQAVLLHNPGHPKRVTILGFTFEPTHHSATRRYYFTRNRIVVYRKYFFRFPRWVVHAMYVSTRETIKCFVGEQERPRKFRNLLLGTWDGMTGRMGKRDGL